MEAHQKQITVYSNHTESAPVIYLPVVVGDGSEVYKCCRELDCPPFALVTIGGLDWNRELSPWACDGTVRDAEPFGGQAADFLDELLNQIIPQVESSLPQPPTWRGIAGYSLAGLFALWSLWQTDAFDRAASASGSLWFPDFVDRASTAPFAGSPQAVYLSLGKKGNQDAQPHDAACTRRHTRDGSVARRARHSNNAGAQPRQSLCPNRLTHGPRHPLDTDTLKMVPTRIYA